MKKLGIIGTGNMAKAIAGGMLEKKSYASDEIMAFNPNPESLRKFCASGMVPADSYGQIMEQCNNILLAVKPQVFPAVLQEIAGLCRPETVIISIAAGISADFIKSYLGRDTKVVLAMPNTPMLVGAGAVSVATVAPTTDVEFAEVKHIFSQSAFVCEVKPEQMMQTIPLHGSSPAMFYLIAQCFVAKGVELGFAPDVANKLFCEGMIGAANMMLKTDYSHQALIDMVCSKGGTTLAMLDALEKNGFSDALSAGFDACLKRAGELGK